MRAVVQRVAKAGVHIGEAGNVGSIGRGILVFLGVGPEDTAEDVGYMAEKVVHLRIFPDEEGRMNRSVLEVEGGVLVVSQFTLYGDCRKGRRPSYAGAAPPELASRLYEEFVRRLGNYTSRVATGQFQELMEVHLINDGPVTLLLDSQKRF